MGNTGDEKSLGQGRLRLEGWPVCPLGWQGQGMKLGPNCVCYGAAAGLYRLLINIHLQNRGDHGGSCRQGCRHQGLGLPACNKDVTTMASTHNKWSRGEQWGLGQQLLCVHALPTRWLPNLQHCVCAPGRMGAKGGG